MLGTMLQMVSASRQHNLESTVILAACKMVGRLRPYNCTCTALFTDSCSRFRILKGQLEKMRRRLYKINGAFLFLLTVLLSVLSS